MIDLRPWWWGVPGGRVAGVVRLPADAEDEGEWSGDVAFGPFVEMRYSGTWRRVRWWPRWALIEGKPDRPKRKKRRRRRRARVGIGAQPVVPSAA